MAKVALVRTRAENGPRAPRNTPPRLTVYRDGLAKLTSSARGMLDNVETIHLLHDSENSNLLYISKDGGFPHKIGKQGTFSAASLHRHIGTPDHPVHVDLTQDADGDLVGDLATAVHGENQPARIRKSEGVPASNGTVDQRAAAANGSPVGPVASGPSDTSDDDNDDSSDYGREDDDIAAIVAVATGKSKK